MKKLNKVMFTYMDVYLFGRCLGSDKVPETGNNPLGMDSYHFCLTRVDIQRKKETQNQLTDDPIIKTSPNFNHELVTRDVRLSDDCESVQSIFSIDYTAKSLQPLNPRQRIKCLKEAGVDMIKDKISLDEGKYLLKLRQERQQVGCKCTGATPCDPNKCACAKEGISCQSDGNSFPCKCGSKCSNPNGRRIYSDLRIKYHYRHVLDRDLSTEFNTESLSSVVVEPKRKRASNILKVSPTKLPKMQITQLGSMDSICEYNPVLIMDNSLFRSKSCDSVFVEPTQSMSICIDDGKENNHSSFINHSPLLPFSLHTSSSRFNDSWSELEWNTSPQASSPRAPLVSYWSSFLNEMSDQPKLQSPMKIEHVQCLNPISLATDYVNGEPLRATNIMPHSTDKRNDSTYTFRQRTPQSQKAYVESPCERSRRKIKMWKKPKVVLSRTAQETISPVSLPAIIDVCTVNNCAQD